MTRHAVDPWRLGVVDPQYAGQFKAAVVDADGNHVAYLNAFTQEQADANAAVVCMAPRLLMELRSLLEHWDKTEKVRRRYVHLERVRAALDEATGAVREAKAARDRSA